MVCKTAYFQVGSSCHLCMVVHGEAPHFFSMLLLYRWFLYLALELRVAFVVYLLAFAMHLVDLEAIDAESSKLV